MGSVVLVADETVAAQPDVVYSLFGARQGAAWVFAADCDVLVGSAVTLQLPVGGGQAAVDILGRVVSLVPQRQIVIALDQPWRGRLRIRLEHTGAESTRVSVTADIDQCGVEWLLRRRGWPAYQPADDGEYRVGLLTSKSGPGRRFRGGPARTSPRWPQTSSMPTAACTVAAVPLMRTSGARHWFLVGDGYSWSHGAHRAARSVLPHAHGVVVGKRFLRSQ